jgi:hypothetical protein
MAGARRWTYAVALLGGIVVASLAALGISARDASSQSTDPQFADWTGVSANVSSGTLLGQAISLSGSHVSDPPGSTVDGTSTTFNEPYFSPPLTTSDAIEFRGETTGYSYTLQFGAPTTDLVLHLDSLASTLEFPAGTQITKVSGESTFTVSGNTVAGVADGPGDDASGTVTLSGSFQSVPFTATYPPGLDGIYVQVGAPPPPDTAPPETTITAGPSGMIQDRTPTFSFRSSEAGSAFRCSVDRVAVGACSSPFTTAALEAGPHRFEVAAVDTAGNVDPTPANRDVRVAAKLADLPAPALATSTNVAPLAGLVLVAVPAGPARAAQKGLKFVPLQEARQIPVGSFLDTRSGTVRLSVARDARGRTQSGDFRAGVFQVLQSRRRSAKGLTELRLKGSSFRRCERRAGRSEARLAQLSRRTIRRLRSHARGRFRTRARSSAATVRGTSWDTLDRCDGTLTRVRRGRVAVRDFRRRRTILVRAGRSYLARARQGLPLRGVPAKRVTPPPGDR